MNTWGSHVQTRTDSKEEGLFTAQLRSIKHPAHLIFSASCPCLLQRHVISCLQRCTSCLASYTCTHTHTSLPLLSSKTCPSLTLFLLQAPLQWPQTSLKSWECQRQTTKTGGTSKDWRDGLESVPVWYKPQTDAGKTTFLKRGKKEGMEKVSILDQKKGKKKMKGVKMQRQEGKKH